MVFFAFLLTMEKKKEEEEASREKLAVIYKKIKIPAVMFINCYYFNKRLKTFSCSYFTTNSVKT